MIAMSKTEFISWCSTNNICVDEFGRPVLPDELDQFEIPSDAGKRLAMVKQQLSSFEKEQKIIVYVSSWSVWPSSERMHIYERFISSYNQTKPLIEIPCYMFEKTEYEDMLSFVTLCVLFLWDAYVIATNTRRGIFYSHDEMGDKFNNLPYNKSLKAGTP